MATEIARSALRMGSQVAARGPSWGVHATEASSRSQTHVPMLPLGHWGLGTPRRATESWPGEALKGMRTATFHFSESGGSLNRPNLFTELPPYQTPNSLNCLPPFHWKPLFFTEKCFVASPSQKSALNYTLNPDVSRWYFSAREVPMCHLDWVLPEDYCKKDPCKFNTKMFVSKVGNPCPTLGQLLANPILYELLVEENQESPRQTKPKKGQFMNFSRGPELVLPRKSTRIHKNGRNSWTFCFGPFYGLVCRGDSWEKQHEVAMARFERRVAQKLVTSWSIPRQLPIPWEVAGILLAVVFWQHPTRPCFPCDIA